MQILHYKYSQRFLMHNSLFISTSYDASLKSSSDFDIQRHCFFLHEHYFYTDLEFESIFLNNILHFLAYKYSC